MTHTPQSPFKPPSHQVDPARYADTDGIVQVAVPCAFCSYSLQTLRLGTNCPECGKGVGFRFVPELLQNTPIEWLRRVRRGLRIYIVWALLGILTGVGLGGGSAILMAFGFISAEQFAALTDSWWYTAAGNVLSLVITAMSAYGAWLFTSPRPASSIPDPTFSRKTVRVCIVISAVAFGVLTIFGFVSGFSRPDEDPTTVELVSLMCIVPIWLISFVAWWRYSAHLLALVPSRRMARVAAWLSWLTVVFFLPYFATIWLILIEPPDTTPPPPYAMFAGTITTATGSAPATATSQWIYFSDATNSDFVTTLPAGTPIYTPKPPSPEFMSLAFLVSPFACCGGPLYAIGVIVVVLRMLRSLSDVVAIAAERDRAPRVSNELSHEEG